MKTPKQMTMKDYMELIGRLTIMSGMASIMNYVNPEPILIEKIIGSIMGIIIGCWTLIPMFKTIK